MPTATTLPACWAVIGVLSTLDADDIRQHIRLAARRFALESMCVRFVVGDNAIAEGATNESTHFGDDIVSFAHVRDSDCGRKSFAWFEHALGAYPAAVWIGKADSDTFVQLRALQFDLLTLEQNSDIVVGQFDWQTYWLSNSRSSSSGSGRGSLPRPGRPCGSVTLHHDTVPRTNSTLGWTHLVRRGLIAQRARLMCNASKQETSDPESGPYPFAVGPLYLLSRSLAARVFSSGSRSSSDGSSSSSSNGSSSSSGGGVSSNSSGGGGGHIGSSALRRFMAEQHFTCAAEDATVGYAIHAASMAAGSEYTYTLAHMVHAKLCALPTHTPLRLAPLHLSLQPPPPLPDLPPFPSPTATISSATATSHSLEDRRLPRASRCTSSSPSPSRAASAAAYTGCGRGSMRRPTVPGRGGRGKRLCPAFPTAACTGLPRSLMRSPRTIRCALVPPSTTTTTRGRAAGRSCASTGSRPPAPSAARTRPRGRSTAGIASRSARTSAGRLSGALRNRGASTCTMPSGSATRAKPTFQAPRGRAAPPPPRRSTRVEPCAPACHRVAGSSSVVYTVSI